MKALKGTKGLTADEVTPEQVAVWRGRVISENPFVRLVSVPTYVEEETLPGVSNGEWRALADVNGSLCVVQLTLWRASE